MSSYFLQSFQLGFKSLLLHKLRAGLAALGIFIGTATVIWLVAIGEGVSYRAQEQIKSLGARNVIIRSIAPPEDGEASSNRVKIYGLLRQDYDRIVNNIPTVVRALPMRELEYTLRNGERTAKVALVGCSEQHLQLNRLSIARGRWLNSDDRGKKRIVLADKVARRLFPYENPIGKTIWVGSEFYTIVGQTKNRGASAAVGGSLTAREYDSDAYIPLKTMDVHVGKLVMTRIGAGFNFKGEQIELSQITVTVDKIQNVDATAKIIETLLKKYHDNDDFAVVVPKELLRQAERTRSMFNILLVVIAGISLLVGGIGIMNIMLATVTERTREIGIRRALGAKRTDIIQQFLVETVVLTATGGLLGVAFGLLCGPLFRLVRRVIANVSPGYLPEIAYAIEPRIALWSVVLSLVISLGVGVLFGVYPARQAAYLDPIEALRHE